VLGNYVKVLFIGMILMIWSWIQHCPPKR